jgi:hypothetical protein
MTANITDFENEIKYPNKNTKPCNQIAIVATKAMTNKYSRD